MTRAKSDVYENKNVISFDNKVSFVVTSKVIVKLVGRATDLPVNKYQVNTNTLSLAAMDEKTAKW